jgi:hypothetical protein
VVVLKWVRLSIQIQKVVDRLELPLTSLKSYHETSPKKLFEVLPDAKDGRLSANLM